MDADLIAKAKQGDEQAFATMVETIDERFFGVAARILHDRELAEDATQRALVGLWRHLPALHDPNRFDAWAYRLLLNACYSEHRRRRRWRFDVRLRAADRPSGVDVAAPITDRDQVERGLRRISVEHRVVLVLRYYLDLSLQQTAETLDLPVGTVSSRLTRAHEALRGILEADARSTVVPNPSEAQR